MTSKLSFISVLKKLIWIKTKIKTMHSSSPPTFTRLPWHTQSTVIMALQVCATFSINPQQFEQDVYVMFSLPVWSLCRAKRAWTGKQWETNSCLPKRDVLTWGCLSSGLYGSLRQEKGTVHACKVTVCGLFFLTQRSQHKQLRIMIQKYIH